jgi:hypothetical protein
MVRTAVALVCAFLVFTAGSLVAPNAARADNYSTVAPGAPPPVPYEAVPPTPGPQYVWVPGHWQYAYNRWVWIRGEWVLAPYAGAVWVPGHWARRAYGWVWIPGHWRRVAVYPAYPPAYAPAYPEGAVVVATPPPPLPVEAVGVPPFVGAIWIGGFWRWNGGAWGWVPGHWARAPWRGAVWVPGHWNHGPRGWIWIGGFWR